MYSIFEMLCKKNGVTPYKVAKDTGISTATLTSWKQGKYAPKADKRKMIADYFGVSLEYLDTGEDEPAYYLNPETAKLAQEINWHKKSPFWSSGTRPERATIIL